MDKSREQFEVEFSKQFPAPLTEIDVFIKEVALKFWQASRESLEIELPPEQEMLDDYDMYEIGFNIAVNRLKEILISNGVKVK